MVRLYTLIFYRYDQSPEYGNKDDIEGVLLSKKLELTTAECSLTTLEGKVSLELIINSQFRIQLYFNLVYVFIFLFTFCYLFVYLFVYLRLTYSIC